MEEMVSDYSRWPHIMDCGLSSLGSFPSLQAMSALHRPVFPNEDM
jgi:hypothetical protein